MTRDEIFARDGFRWVRVPSGRGNVHPAADLTLDHVQPRLRGGDRTAGNIVTACSPCNVLKGHRSLAAYLADDDRARDTFFRYAAHVWPRHLRAVRQELEKRRGSDP
jgi:5-methylcytosine-specific restriction endonuclease McrA